MQVSPTEAILGAGWHSDWSFQERPPAYTILHSAILPYSPRGMYAPDADQRSMKFRLSEKAEEMRNHPLVRVHPISGRNSIYASQVYTIGIEGLDSEEGAALLNELHEQLVQEKYPYRHQRAKNTLRVMHRTTVKGESPVAASMAVSMA